MHILDTYKTFIRRATEYYNGYWECRLVCAAYKLGIPHEIMDVKWFRNGKEISDQSGFKLIERDLLIEVGINFINVKAIALNSRPKNL